MTNRTKGFLIGVTVSAIVFFLLQVDVKAITITDYQRGIAIGVMWAAIILAVTRLFVLANREAKKLLSRINEYLNDDDQRISIIEKKLKLKDRGRGFQFFE